MTTWYVQESGGDYTGLQSCLGNASTVNGDTVEIAGSWTADDDAAATIADDLTITVTGSAKHPGYLSSGSWTHHRLKLATSGTDILTLSGAYTATITGLVVIQNSTGTSDEAIDVRPGTSDSVTISNCICMCETSTTQQDCIYTGYNQAIGTVNVVQSILYGANRAGINIQNSTTGPARAVTVNVNSCTIWGCGTDDPATAAGSGGIICFKNGFHNSTTINVHNTICVGSVHANALDYYESTANGTAIWGISYSCDSDNTIASRDAGGSGNLANRVPLDATADGGSEVLFNDITTDIDLRLQDHANNTAQDAHAVGTAEGLTIPTTADIVGTSRPQDTNYDVGAFEIAAGGATTIPQFMNRRFLSTGSYASQQVGE